MLKKILKKYFRNLLMTYILVLCMSSLAGCKHIPIIGEVFPFSWIDL